VALLGAGLVRSIEPEAVATFEVRPDRLVREVPATGTPKAVKATTVIVPLESGRAPKVAFLARDGAHLAKGEPAVEGSSREADAELIEGSTRERGGAGRPGVFCPLSLDLEVAPRHRSPPRWSLEPPLVHAPVDGEEHGAAAADHEVHVLEVDFVGRQPLRPGPGEEHHRLVGRGDARRLVETRDHALAAVGGVDAE
jgi:hypothetical protein